MSKQTGPRTEEGKKSSSQNNRRHGLATANIIVLPHERPIFDQIEAELRNEIQPDGPLETIAFRRLITANWQMEKCQQREATLIAQEPSEQNEANLERVRRYYLRWEGSFNSAFRQIRLLQTDRGCQGYMNGDAPDRFAPVADLPKIERYARRIASPKSFEAKICQAVDNRIDALKATRQNPGCKGGVAVPTPPKSTLCETKSPTPDLSGVGRNSPCPCGSGRKFKRCCGVNAPPILNDQAA